MMFKNEKKQQMFHLVISQGLCLIILAGMVGCTPPATQVPPTSAPGVTQAPPTVAPTVVPPKPASVIKIGVLAPMTGTSAADGEEMVRGAQLAVKEINAAGGVLGYTFEVIPGDTKDQIPDAVTSAIERITADPDVHVMMTGYADGANFEIENMSQLNMPYLISANSAQTYGIISPNPDKYPTVWSITPSYDAYETELPRLLEKWAGEGKITLNNRKVAMISSDNPYSETIAEGLKKSFTKINWTITVDETVPFGEVLDWRTILGKIRNDPPDLIVNTDYLPGNEATFLNQFLEDPTDSILFMQYGPSVPEFYDLTKDGSTGVLYNLLGGIIRSPKNTLANTFLELFMNEYGVDTGGYGYMLYLSVYAYTEALKIVGSPIDHTAIGNALGGLSLDSAIGTIKFDPATHLALQGDEYVPIQFYQLWDGERVLLNPDKFATGSVQMPPWIGQP